ncbi:MAG TPA: L-threonylcarbamoyladenylate synthase [Bacteroidota bacterium]|nr:L-threonylcarbamoyladenylate synthase [Bacteroidota bacterium]
MALRLNVDLLAPGDRVLMLAAEVIQAGGVIVYPTDTLYGLGANAWNPEAVARLHLVKRREEPKPTLVLVHDAAEVAALTDEITEGARALMASLWPGALTLLFRAAPHVSTALTAGTGKIGVRLPASAFCTRLCALAGCPVTSTSANISGSAPLSRVAEIEKAVGPSVDLFVDGGPLEGTLPSTVVDATGPVPRLVREGVISRDRIERIVPTALG